MKRSERTAQGIALHITNLASDDPTVAVRAERYLIHYGVRALPELIEACTHPLWKVRLRAGWALATTRHPDAFDPIHRLCFDPVDEVRYDSRIALGILGHDRCLVTLIRMIEMGDTEDGAVLMGLSRMMPQGFSVVDALFRRSNSLVRMTLINVVGAWAEKHSLPAAIELLRLAEKDEDEDLRCEAAYWLSEISNEP